MADRFSDTKFQVLDARFRRYDGDFAVERIWRGSLKTEGPAYFPAGRYLVWSDIPRSQLMRWDETTGRVGVFRTDSHHANGNTIDAQGRLLTCEQGARRVTRTEHDGQVTVLVDSYQGMRLNSPNDVVTHSDGSIWFSDPSYGIDSDYEGNAGQQDLPGCFVFRLDPHTGHLKVVADDFCRPNGLAFSPDEKQLFIVDTRQEPSHIRVFAVGPDGDLDGGHVFATCDYGRFDGIRLDASGNVWAAAWDGLHCFAAEDGQLIGKLLLPEPVSNLTFGGASLNQLYICAGRSVYTLRTTFNGAPRPHGGGRDSDGLPRPCVSIAPRQPESRDLRVEAMERP